MANTRVGDPREDSSEKCALEIEDVTSLEDNYDALRHPEAHHADGQLVGSGT